MLARRHGLSSAGCWLGAVALALAALWSASAGSWVVAAFAAAAAVVCVLAGRGFWAQSRKAAVGARSERTVARVLARSGAHVVVHGAMLGAGGDLDHAVVGPVLVAVETKTGRGEVRVDGDGRLWVGRRQVLGSPTSQAHRQAVALGRAAGGFAQAVVCVVDMANAPFVHRGVTVCSAGDLVGVLRGFPSVLRADESRAVAGRLAPPG
jgi:hypothetical protein